MDSFGLALFCKITSREIIHKMTGASARGAAFHWQRGSGDRCSRHVTPQQRLLFPLLLGSNFFLFFCSWEDLSDHQVYVRQFRQYLPGMWCSRFCMSASPLRYSNVSLWELLGQTPLSRRCQFGVVCEVVMCLEM